MAATRGRLMLIKVGSAATGTLLGGLRTTSFKMNNQVIDISTKDTNGWREVLEDGSLKSVTLSGDGIFKDSNTDETIRAAVFSGYSQLQALREAANAACEPFDFVLSPVSPMPAYPAHLASPLHDPQRPFEHIAFTLPCNMSEQPALALNAGYTAAGLPIGLQLIGRRFDDAGVLALGAAWEQLRPAQRPWPVDGSPRWP